MSNIDVKKIWRTENGVAYTTIRKGGGYYFHRKNGPAKIYPDGYEEWHVKGRPKKDRVKEFYPDGSYNLYGCYYGYKNYYW